MRNGLLTLVLLGFAGGVFAVAPSASPSFTPEELAKAQEALDQEVAGAETPAERALRVARLALFKRPGGALQYLADKAFRSEIGTAQAFIPSLFIEGDAQAKRIILDLYYDSWKVLGVANDSWTTELVRQGLDNPDWAVRRAAARLMAERPIFKITHWAIDAAEAEPVLTQAALMAIAQAGEETGTRWATTKLADQDPGVRQAALRVVALTSQRAKLFLKEQMDSDQDQVRRSAVDAFMMVSQYDDIPVLQAWLEKNQSRDPELVKKVSRVLAELEAGTHQFIIPQAPELVLPEKEPASGVTGRAGKR